MNEYDLWCSWCGGWLGIKMNVDYKETECAYCEKPINITTENWLCKVEKGSVRSSWPSLGFMLP